MDIDAALANMRELVKAALESEAYGITAEDLAEQFESIDTWLSSGGFLPVGWSLRNREPIAPEKTTQELLYGSKPQS